MRGKIALARDEESQSLAAKPLMHMTMLVLLLIWFLVLAGKAVGESRGRQRVRTVCPCKPSCRCNGPTPSSIFFFVPETLFVLSNPGSQYVSTRLGVAAAETGLAPEEI